VSRAGARCASSCCLLGEERKSPRQASQLGRKRFLCQLPLWFYIYQYIYSYVPSCRSGSISALLRLANGHNSTGRCRRGVGSAPLLNGRRWDWRYGAAYLPKK
jgi:hypothetical protein